MSSIIGSSLLPSPRVPLSFRVATRGDLPALDALQKLHRKQLGFFPRAQLEGYVANGWILVAESEEEGGRMKDQGAAAAAGARLGDSSLCLQPSSFLVGYCASRDRYLKRDELGVVYQLCVDPAARRMNVGAALVREVFARSAYGCRLYCCWCAQDLAANRFWESLGFVPIAFRAGSTGRRRVHLFWQRRVNAEDVTTPYWYPCQTNAGAIREDRLVLPVPPGVRWSEVKAVVQTAEQARLDDQSAKTSRSSKKSMAREVAVVSPQRGPATRTFGGWSFNPPPSPEPVKLAKAARTPKAKATCDPKLVNAARELRDRWLERLNAGEALQDGEGKYDVAKCLGGAGVRPLSVEGQETKGLPLLVA